MRTASKVFLIIGIVQGTIMMAAGMIFHFFPIIIESTEGYVTTTLAISLSLPFAASLSGAGVVMALLCVGVLTKLKEARRAADISLVYEVFVLILGSLIAGLLLLCMDDDDFAVNEGSDAGLRQSTTCVGEHTGRIAAKVFLILGIIVGALLLSAGVVLIVYTLMDSSMFALLPVGIFLVLLGLVKALLDVGSLVQLGCVRSASELPVGFTVCVMLLGSLVAGVLLLRMRDRKLSCGR